MSQISETLTFNCNACEGRFRVAFVYQPTRQPFGFIYECHHCHSRGQMIVPEDIQSATIVKGAMILFSGNPADDAAWSAALIEFGLREGTTLN